MTLAEGEADETKNDLARERAQVGSPSASANSVFDARFCIQVKDGNVTAVRERIERMLGVETGAWIENGRCCIYFHAPANTDFDFLRPDVLPPLSHSRARRSQGARRIFA